jgi:hypothetical protein
MAITILSIACLLIVPVAIGWRIALHQMKDNAAPLGS